MNEHSQDLENTEISDEIAHSLHHSWFFDPQTIAVTTHHGVVTLSGDVSSTHDRRRAAVAAWSHPKVTDVINDIHVV